MNRTLLLALMIAGSALSAAHAQTSPSPMLSSPSFPLDSTVVPGDSGGGTAVMPPTLPSPSAPGLPTPSSPSGSAGIPGGGGAAAPPPTAATPLGTMFQRPDIQTQPPGAGVNSGIGTGYDGNIQPLRR
jgi:hypothetical protein